MITPDQIKDLRPIKQGEKFPIPSVFYLKCEDGFHTCEILEEDKANEERMHIFRLYTRKYIEDGRLFTRINRPFCSFQS